MNIRQLEAFHATIQTGSITRAADKLGITQPAVSKLMRAFSESCGFKLFTRSSGRLVPTQEARILALEVERLFSGTERIAKLAAAVRNHEWGNVTLAAPPALATRFLPQALARFLGSQTDLHFALQSQSSPRIVELIAGHQIDIGLSVLPVDHPQVTAERIVRFNMVCVLPANHRLAAKRTLDIDDLRHETFISLARDDCSMMSIDRAFQLKGIQKRSRVEVPLSETACSFVANGVGISIVPPFVGLDYSDGQLVRRPVLPAMSMDVWLLTPSTRPPSLAAQQMSGVLRDALTQFDGAERH